SSLLYGYNLAVVNSPAVHIKAFYNATWSQHYGQSPSQALLTIMYSLTVSVFALGGLVGSFPVGMLVTRYGRKGAWLEPALGAPPPAQSRGDPEGALPIAQCDSSSLSPLPHIPRVSSSAQGICLSVVPMYLGEIAPKNLRGFLGLVPSIFICLGVFSAQVLGLPELLGEVSAAETLLKRGSPHPPRAPELLPDSAGRSGELMPGWDKLGPAAPGHFCPGIPAHE
uniref:Uncharacterized protein n=1 Tax=Chelonoidis abingdonii TaxID=106734 RepID=A0A8C0G943_CHEAB